MSTQALLEQSIRHGLASIGLQLDAMRQPPPASGAIVVQPGQSLPAVVAEAPAGAVVYVPPEVRTVLAEDLILSKPVSVRGNEH
jgi:hypothetical protein